MNVSRTRAVWFSIVVLTWYFLLEAMGAMVGSPPTVSWLYPGLSLLLLWATGGILTAFLDGPWTGRSMPGFLLPVSLILIFPFTIVTWGSPGVLLTAVIGGLGVMGGLMLLHFRLGSPGSLPDRGWTPLVLAAFLSGPGLVSGLLESPHGPIDVTGIYLALGGGIVLWGLLLDRAWPSLPDWLWLRRIPVAVLTAAALLAAGIVWHDTARTWPPHPYSGTLPEPRLAAGTTVEELPNIILISIDTLRWDAVPPRADSPGRLENLRQLRRDSVVLGRLFSSSPWTLPSHASLFSGIPPPLHGAYKDMFGKIRRDVPLFPQYLQSLGYRTAGFTGGGFVDKNYGFARGYDTLRESPFPDPASDGPSFPGALQWTLDGLRLLGMEPPRPALSGKGDHPLRFPSFRRTTKQGLRWIRARPDRDERPFYLFLHTYHVHQWHLMRRRMTDRLMREKPDLARAALPDRILRRGGLTPDRENRSLLRSLRGGTHPKKQDRDAFPLRWVPIPEDRRDSFGMDPLGTVADLRDLSPDETHRLGNLLRTILRAQHQVYSYEVEALDRVVGSFLDALRKEGLYRDSVIVFLSDHGEGFSLDPLVYKHRHRVQMDGEGQLHDVLLRVPVWIKLPGNRLAGRTVGSLLQIEDVFPILLDELGIRVPDPRPESPPLNLRTAEEDPGRRFVYGMIQEPRQHSQKFMIRRDGYKLNLRLPGGLENSSGDTPPRDAFWSVSDTDPSLEYRVDPDSVPAGVRRRLREHMTRKLESLALYARNDSTPIGAERRRELEALGYL